MSRGATVSVSACDLVSVSACDSSSGGLAKACVMKHDACAVEVTPFEKTSGPEVVTENMGMETETLSVCEILNVSRVRTFELKTF